MGTDTTKDELVEHLLSRLELAEKVVEAAREYATRSKCVCPHNDERCLHGLMCSAIIAYDAALKAEKEGGCP